MEPSGVTLTVAFPFLAALLIAATLLPLIRKEAWWIRIFDFPRVQIAVAGGMVIILWLMLFPGRGTAETALLLLLGIAVLYQSYRMYPYTPFAGAQVVQSSRSDPEEALSLVVSNVLMTNRRAADYIALIRAADPDLVLAAEPDRRWEEELRPLEGDYPYTVKYPLDNTYGMLLYSRLELRNPAVRFLVEPDIPSIHTLVKLPSGALVELHFLHPKPPHPVRSKDTVKRDAELLLMAREVRKSARPVIVAGDLNDVAWSSTTTLFQRVSSLLDPRIGRGFYNTYNAKYPVFRYPLDHVFHSSHFRLIGLRRLGFFGSDHFPIFIALSYEPEGSPEQKAPPPTGESIKQARKKIEKAR
ncbi:MAG: endonuclease/exonuclease/phosphatase family protein [Nitrospirota bacterium]